MFWISMKYSFHSALSVSPCLNMILLPTYCSYIYRYWINERMNRVRWPKIRVDRVVTTQIEMKRQAEFM